MKVYHKVTPQNYKPTGYTEYGDVSFVCTFDQRLMNLNSVRINGTITTNIDPATTANDAFIYLDPDVGAHSFFNSFITEINGDTIENISSDYGRLVKMKTTATQNKQSMLSAKNVCELKAPFASITNDLLQGERPPYQPTAGQVPANALRNSIDFSIKPEICLNNAVGQLAYRKTGDVTVNLVLERNANVFYGPNMNSNITYTLNDLELTFTSDDDNGEDEPVIMTTYQTLNQSIQSSFANASVRVASLVDGVSGSFQLNSEMNGLKTNAFTLYHPPNISSLQFLYNDSTNTYLTYELKNQVEILSRYLESWNRDHNMNSVSMASVINNEGFGIGLDMPFTDLRQQKFNIQLTSDINPAISTVMYLFFKSVLRM